MNACTDFRHRLTTYNPYIKATWCACRAEVVEGWHAVTRHGHVQHRCTCHPAGLAPATHEGDPQ